MAVFFVFTMFDVGSRGFVNQISENLVAGEEAAAEAASAGAATPAPAAEGGH